MIILDRALSERERNGNPVRVGLVGAGYMGRGITRQFLTVVEGMRLVAISNRTVEKAEHAYRDAGASEVETVEDMASLDAAVDRGAYAVTRDPSLLCASEQVDVIIEATGEVEFGARVALDAVEGGKHLILMNAELDATVGPILKTYADDAGVVVSNTDGDQPGVLMNLYRWVDMIGYRPVLMGNIKGLYDPYRTPETQKEFAERHNQRPRMVTSFADGTKLSMEMAVVANASGFRAGRRGMYGPRCDHVREAPDLFNTDELREGGLVDYVLGAEPGPGVFVLGYDDDPVKQGYMEYLKMGEGPLYVFYVPYHLPHLEVAGSAARAALFQDPVITPKGGPVCDVIAVAKKDLEAGETLDGIGGFASYGLLENHDVSRREGFLPMGLSQDCKLTADVQKDSPITYSDVELPEDRLCDDLRSEQDRRFRDDTEEAAASTPPGEQ